MTFECSTRSLCGNVLSHSRVNSNASISVDLIVVSCAATCVKVSNVSMTIACILIVILFKHYLYNILRPAFSVSAGTNRPRTDTHSSAVLVRSANLAQGSRFCNATQHPSAPRSSDRQKPARPTPASCGDNAIPSAIFFDAKIRAHSVRTVDRFRIILPFLQIL